MRESTLRSFALALAAAYGIFIAWLYVRRASRFDEMAKTVLRHIEDEVKL